LGTFVESMPTLFPPPTIALLYIMCHFVVLPHCWCRV